MIPPEDIVLVVLAAGRSSRFGRPKLLEHLHGKPLACYALRLADRFPFGRKVAIVPPGLDQLEDLCAAAGFQTVVNESPDAGMSRSLRLGMAAMGEMKAMLVLLADMPFVTESHIAALMNAYDPMTGCVASSREGVGQPPALIGKKRFDTLAGMEGDKGARQLVRSGLLIEADPDLLQDIDDPQTLDKFNRA